MTRIAPLLLVPAALVVLASLGGCRGEAVASRQLSDRLYALYLDRAPTASDWERALPRIVVVRGGRVHKANPLADVDSDTVHVTTASCHHGSTPPAPLEVDMRAFHTASELYLRLSWPDSTRDDAMRSWVFDGKEWRSELRLEDGFGILWDNERKRGDFTCSRACHIDNFGVSGANFHAVNRMKLPTEEEGRLDLWNWKAGRTARAGFVDDRTLDVRGMEGDTPGDLFPPNSRARLDGKGEGEIFGAGDRPIYDERGEPIDKEFRPAGSRAPGYLTDRPLGSRGDIAAYSTHAAGRWTVVLRRALVTNDSRDAVFAPGPEGIPFGLSVMDDTIKEHYASVAPERLVLLPAAVAVSAAEE